MLHITFQGNWPSDSGEEYFLKFSPYMGIAAAWSCHLDHIYKLSFPLSWRLQINLIEIGQEVSEEMCIENVDDGRKTDSGQRMAEATII